MQTMKKRLSNLELLRIICMFLLIAHHYAVHSGILETQSHYRLFILFFIPWGKICFVAFLALSMWFLVEQDFKLERFFKIWFQVLFYSLLLCSIYCSFHHESFFFVAQEFLGAFFPIIGKTAGFPSAYLLFYLFFPFTKKLIENLKKHQLAIFLCILFYAQVFGYTAQYVLHQQQDTFSELQLFILCYAVMFFIKRHTSLAFSNIPLLLAGVFMPYFYSLIANYLYHFQGIRLGKFLLHLSENESSLPNIIAGFSLFFLFETFPHFYNKAINKIATGTFAVLLIHDSPYFSSILWKNIVKVQSWFYSPFFSLYFYITINAIFWGGELIDFVRQYLFRIVIKNSIPSRHITDRLYFFLKEHIYEN